MAAIAQFRDLLEPMLAGQPIKPAAFETLFVALVDGELEPIPAAAFLTALRIQGEQGWQLAAGARILRERMIPFDTGGVEVMDTCGMGGDGAGTFNVSTAVAFVVAAAGVPVVKHGNRAVSGKSGSSDVLRELGLPVDRGPAWASETFRAHGLAFCHAPDYHPALTRLAPLRQQLGVRTILNCLGPLVNPARPSRQLIGLARPELLRPFAEAVRELGTRRTVLVCGNGFDEVTLDGATEAWIVEGDSVRQETWTAGTFGLVPMSLGAVRVRDAAESANVIRGVLSGTPGPALDFVLANGASALWAGGMAVCLTDGIKIARSVVESGRANQLLKLAAP